ncbi:alpha-amylase family glycosyl hydrolase [Aliagarivorans taiwanensis]|uniref:alpha-amylase family glycosyl hydrolase n=1 Tax=Aliagarivorans taiwanensis TaxID=561966 RepID=UPI000413AB6F|nr:alpha-amylase family glycosyl hydrolase [Aliagarivorans taiwanensis]
MSLTSLSPFPLLYQLNTRVELRKLSEQLGRAATLDDIDDALLKALREQGFQWLWLLGVWQTGPLGQQISRQHPSWQEEFRHTLPDLSDDDIPGSCFAVYDYQVHGELGGNAALLRLRKRAHAAGLRVMLDFVPNHMAPDHPWLESHPDYFIQGDQALLESQPDNYYLLGESALGEPARIVAHGRDPYFPGWPDTAQLDYANPECHQAMLQQLLRISELCDGLRCDMAMLLEPHIFEQTWGRACAPFWPEAIARVKQAHPAFTFMAEVYWGREWAMQQQGFNFAYDKELLDRLIAGDAEHITGHLRAEPDYQHRLARFLENHDEQRAAKVFFDKQHQAAALLSYLSPGLRFFQHGQLEGWRTHIPPHLNRGPQEQTNPELAEFYRDLLVVLGREVVHRGQWCLLDTKLAAPLIGIRWRGEGHQPLLVVVNYSAQSSASELDVSALLEASKPRVLMQQGAQLASDKFEKFTLGPWGYVIVEGESVR